MNSEITFDLEKEKRKVQTKIEPAEEQPLGSETMEVDMSSGSVEDVEEDQPSRIKMRSFFCSCLCSTSIVPLFFMHSLFFLLQNGMGNLSEF
jgi:hypothetical protein